MTVSKRISQVNISSTMKIAQEAKEMLSRGIDVIDLSVGELDYPTPANVKAAAIRAIDLNLTKYTINSGTIELREAVSQKLKRENNLNYSPAEIIVSAGAKQCVYNAIQSIVNDDDEVIFSSPYWVSYPEMVSLSQGKSIIIPTNEIEGFKINPVQLKETISSRTKLLILCNPTNPTGSLYNRSELENIAEIVSAGNFYVIADEIYEKLVYDNNSFVSFASLSEKIKSKTILVNGLSKAYAMTGWRIGYAAGPEHIIKAMNKIQSHSTSNASSISQAAAIEALLGPQTFIEEMRKDYEKRRDFFYKKINSIKGINCLKPQGTFYLFPQIKSFFNRSSNIFRIEHSFDLAMYLLYEAAVAAVPGSSFGCEGYLRMSYTASMDKLAEATERIKDALGRLN
ncbi:MAG: pyridoxal phosphate-dependent aminotransferase [Bacteroidota bacterium]